MERFGIDFHVHTSVSPDGLDDPVRVVEAAKRAGLRGIAVTDHDRRGAFDALVEAGLADRGGGAVDGFLVIPGVEVSTIEGHVLVIGTSWDAPAGMTCEEVVRIAHDRGAVVVAAHPFDRTRSGVGRSTLDRVDFDAVEVFNSKSIDRRSNDDARGYAERHGMVGIGGSDAHMAGVVGRAHTVVEAEELSVACVVSAVRAGRVEVVEGVHTWVEVLSYWLRGWVAGGWLRDWLPRCAAGWRRRVFGGVAPRVDGVLELGDSGERAVGV